LNVAFGENTIAVDTHIFRVANRTGLAPGKTPREVEDKLVAIGGVKSALNAHQWLILHGRYTCVARKPLCPTCVVNDLCRFKDKTVEPKAPTKTTPPRKRSAPAVKRKKPR
jgi:endonuclease-3